MPNLKLSPESLKKMSAIEARRYSSLEYFWCIIKEDSIESLRSWLRNEKISYNWETFWPITLVEVEKNENNPNKNSLRITKKWGNSILIPFSEIRPESKNIRNLPEAPKNWIKNNPASSFCELPATSTTNNQESKAVQTSILSRFSSWMKDALKDDPKPAKNPQIKQDSSDDLPPEYSIFNKEFWRRTKKQPETIPAEPVIRPITEPIIEEILQPEQEPALVLDEKDIPDFSLEEADTKEMEIVSLEDIPSVQESYIPGADVQVWQAEIIEYPSFRRNPRSFWQSLSNGVKHAVASTLLLSSVQNVKKQEKIQPIVSITTSSPTPKEKQTPSEVTLEVPIVPRTTIFGICKRLNLPKEAHSNYQKYWLVNTTDGEIFSPEATKLPINATLVYYTHGVPEEYQHAKKIQSWDTVWNYLISIGQKGLLKDNKWIKNWSVSVIVKWKKQVINSEKLAENLPVGGIFHFSSPTQMEKDSQNATFWSDESSKKEVIYDDSPISQLIDKGLPNKDESLIQKVNPKETLAQLWEIIYPESGIPFPTLAGDFISHSQVFYKNETGAHECTVMGRSANGWLILRLDNHNNVLFALKPESVKNNIILSDS